MAGCSGVMWRCTYDEVDEIAHGRRRLLMFFKLVYFVELANSPSLPPHPPPQLPVFWLIIPLETDDLYLGLFPSHCVAVVVYYS
ncbi:unnamed protein product [Mesocestoides corti]|uniref:Uncharacterized protein n=1 Tax=Mesocestoides corti TaxID=53468 RepID=A0A0R3UQU2_MESCO|nr:unnamed protein product [Mesocestoides corti]